MEGFMLSAVINVLVAIMSVATWVYILVGASKDRTLAERGVGSFKYYTVLSNLLNAVICAVYAFCLLRGTTVPMGLLCLKLMSASTVTLTLLVTAILLRPLYGWKSLYVGGNFWLHLVLPLLTILDVCLFVPVGMLPVWAVLLGAVPTALYAVWYISMQIIHRNDENRAAYDFYGLLRWGEDKIALVAAAMFAVTITAALLMYLLSHWGLSPK
jgi:hypothetical protein